MYNLEHSKNICALIDIYLFVIFPFLFFRKKKIAFKCRINYNNKSVYYFDFSLLTNLYVLKRIFYLKLR